MKNIVILGAGGFGREVAWLIEEINSNSEKWNIVGFSDDNKNILGQTLNGYKVLGSINDFEIKEEMYFTCAIGNSKIKKLVVEKALSKGLKPATLIHPSVLLDKSNKLEEGITICKNSIVTVNCELKKYTTINLACTVGHDVIIGEYVTVYPSVSISGNCIIGSCVELGTKSAIIQGHNIGENSIIGAGTIVVRDIESNCTAVGVPAKVIKRY